MENHKNENFLIMVINPGSTSTKVSVYRGEECRFNDIIRHEKPELSGFSGILEQKDFRKKTVLELLSRNGYSLAQMDAIVGRGGLVRPIESGTYLINDAMLRDLTITAAAVHASSLGGIIAKELGDQCSRPSFVVDPVVVDEMEASARFTGIPGIERKSAFHALNHKAVARKCAEDMGKKYEDCRFIVAHMGGGVTVGAHRYGRVIDVNDGINGEGPFSPERCGGAPLAGIVRMCFSGEITQAQMFCYMQNSGGMLAYLGTNDLREVERRILDGDEKADRVLHAMAYQIGKEIGSMYAVLEGHVDAVILTGGLAFSVRLTSLIKQMVAAFAKVVCYPGEEEMKQLAGGGLRVLTGEEQPKEYF